MSLHELQVTFLDGTLRDRPAAVCAHILENGIPAERRLAIYRNNAVEGFLKTLAATFPVVLRLSGEDWFRQVGRSYMRAHPSRSGNIHYVGERFAAFLDAELGDSDYSYFADVARLEWAYQEVLVAADHQALDVTALAAVPPEAYAALTFQTHPAQRLVRSRFPVLAIWKANQPTSAPDAPIALDDGPSHVLIARREDHVELRELPVTDFDLLEALSRGATLEQAADRILNNAPHVDLGAALARITQLGTLVGFTAPSYSKRSLP